MARAIINADIEDRIRSAIEKARANPVSLDDLRRMVRALPAPIIGFNTMDRLSHHNRRGTETVLLPGGYRAAVSFEQHPRGLCIHLSVWVDGPGKLPAPKSFVMITRAFGLTEPWTPPQFREPANPGQTSFWFEEFEPGHTAFNIMQVVVPSTTAQDRQIGLRLRDIRERRGISQAELARALGVSVAMVEHWEHGRDPLIELKIEMIAQTLSVKPAELYDPRSYRAPWEE